MTDKLNKQTHSYINSIPMFRFKESTHLRKHLYTHTGERPHFCSYCSKGFQTSSDLKRHKKTRVHQERVDQCNAERVNSNPETPTEKSNILIIFYPSVLPWIKIEINLIFVK